MHIKKKEALQVLKILEDASYEARLVGGCVRDELLGLEPKDYDIACTASPEQMLTVFKKHHIRTLLHGKEHGTITVLMKSGPIEVTTLREDLKTDGRRAEVSFHNDFEIDACRRDFTINAMSQNAKGEIFDYFEGKKHLQEKRIAFVGNPTTRIREDYLRILRFFRFEARFSLHSDAQTLDAICKDLQGLSKVSHERITKELEGILQCEDLKETVEEMSKTGVLAFLFPEYGRLSEKDKNELKICFALFKDVQVEWRFQTRIAILFWFIKFNEWDRSPLKLSNKDRNFIKHLLSAAELLPTLKEGVGHFLLFIDKFDIEEHLFVKCVAKFLETVYAHDKTLLDKIKKLKSVEITFGARRKALPIEGKEVMTALGISPGPLVGEALQALRFAHLEGEWRTKEEALKWLKKWV